KERLTVALSGNADEFSLPASASGAKGLDFHRAWTSAVHPTQPNAMRAGNGGLAGYNLSSLATEPSLRFGSHVMSRISQRNRGSASRRSDRKHASANLVAFSAPLKRPASYSSTKISYWMVVEVFACQRGAAMAVDPLPHLRLTR